MQVRADRPHTYAHRLTGCLSMRPVCWMAVEAGRAGHDTEDTRARRRQDPPTPACAAAVALAETLVLAAGEVLMQVLYCSESYMGHSAGRGRGRSIGSRGLPVTTGDNTASCPAARGRARCSCRSCSAQGSCSRRRSGHLQAQRHVYTWDPRTAHVSTLAKTLHSVMTVSPASATDAPCATATVGVPVDTASGGGGWIKAVSKPDGMNEVVRYIPADMSVSAVQAKSSCCEGAPGYRYRRGTGNGGERGGQHWRETQARLIQET